MAVSVQVEEMAAEKAVKIVSIMLSAVFILGTVFVLYLTVM